MNKKLELQASGDQQADGDQESPQETEAPESETGESLDAAAMRAELSRARREAARYRTDLRKLQEAQEAKKQADMTEVERLQEQVKALEQETARAQEAASGMIVRTQATIAATRAGIRPDAVDLVLTLIEAENLEVGESGEVAGLEELIAQIVKDRPFLAASETKGRISPTNPSEGSVGETRQQKLDRIMYGRRNTMFGGNTIVRPDSKPK